MLHNKIRSSENITIFSMDYDIEPHGIELPPDYPFCLSPNQILSGKLASVLRKMC